MLFTVVKPGLYKKEMEVAYNIKIFGVPDRLK